jgi:hypothetical protein
MAEGSWVGVDLRARSAVAGVLDGATGGLWIGRVPAAGGPLVEWLLGLPAPVRLAYEAGPTGFGLARARVRRRGSCVWWRRRARSRGWRRSGSRPTAATRSGWRGFCGSVN